MAKELLNPRSFSRCCCVDVAMLFRDISCAIQLLALKDYLHHTYYDLLSILFITTYL